MDERRPGIETLASPFKGGVIEGWPSGIDNRSADSDVPRSALRDAVNVDILSSGKPRMRRGMRQVIADAGAHSVFATTDWLIWATANTLNISGPNLTKTVLLTDTRLSAPISYVLVNGRVYFSNENINGTITEDGLLEPWGITPPTTAPNMSASGAGTVNRYIMLTCTFVLDSGEESGAPPARRIACPDDPVVTVTNIPQSSDTRVVATRLYFSAVDGSVLYHYVDVPAGTVSYVANGDFYDLGQPLETLLMEPPPPGHLLSARNGAIHIAVGSRVVHTQPMRYGLVDPGDKFYLFAERINLLSAMDEGVFIGADQTYFIKNAVAEDPTQQAVLPYRPLVGTLVNMPNSNDVMWFSERGFVRGNDKGEVQNVTEMMIAVDSYQDGACGIVEYDGHRAVVATFKERTASTPYAARDYLEVRDA